MARSHQNIISRRNLLVVAGAAGPACVAGAIGLAAYGRTAASQSFGIEHEVLQRFAESFDGTLVLPTDSYFEMARRAVSHNSLTSVRPAAIAYCTSADDILRCLEFASEINLAVAVRSGGCDILGRSTVDAGLVIDLSLINEVDEIGSNGHVTIGAGITAGAVNAALSRQGGLVPLGCDRMVGVAGLTLGGGLGWVLGRYGTACDNLVAANLITVDGQCLHLSANDNTELFWAVRGGGGNFGIVTDLTFKTQPITQVIGGYLVYPLDQAREFLIAYPELMADAPRELMVELAMLNTARGVMLVAMTCFCGQPEHADRALAPFRNFGSPIGDDVGVRDYQSVGSPSPQMVDRFPAPTSPAPTRQPTPPDNFNHWRGCNIDHITQAEASAIIDAIIHAPPGGSFGLGHFMKGAAIEVDPASTSMPRHRGSMCAYFSASWSYADEEVDTMAWVDAANSVLRQQQNLPTYANYLASDRASDVVRTYGDNYARLSRIKARWDPNNILKNNRNIRPTTVDTHQ